MKIQHSYKNEQSEFVTLFSLTHKLHMRILGPNNRDYRLRWKKFSFRINGKGPTHSCQHSFTFPQVKKKKKKYFELNFLFVK